MPVPAVAAGAAHRPAAARAELREALLARVQAATASAWACQDSELDAEIAALEAVCDGMVPSVAELEGPPPDPCAGPPDGAWAWLADLPGPLLEEYLAAAEPPGPEPPAGLWDRAEGDELPPGPVLAGLAGDVCAAGLGRCSEDELFGVLRAGRRLASWSAWLELSATGELIDRRMAQEAPGRRTSPSTPMPRSRPR